MNIESYWAAILAVAVWPVGILLLVLVVLVFAPRDQQATVLNAVAELVRAARDRRP